MFGVRFSDGVRFMITVSVRVISLGNLSRVLLCAQHYSMLSMAGSINTS